VLRDKAARKLGVEGMAAAGGAVVHSWALAWRSAALLGRDVRGILQDIVDGDEF
jgi:hypothetical protein